MQIEIEIENFNSCVWKENQRFRRKMCFLHKMLADSGADGSDYEGVDEDVDEDVDEEFDEDSGEDSDEDVPQDVLLALNKNRLEDPNGGVRSRALEALGQLEPAALARHAGAVVAKLEDSDKDVRKAAVRVKTFGKLEQATRALHADAVVAKFHCNDGQVRAAAMRALGDMNPATLAHYVNVVIAKLEDSYWFTRLGALETMGKLDPATLARHADAVVARLQDSDSFLRLEALATLCKLERATFAQHAIHVLEVLEDDEGHVRKEAMRMLLALPRIVTRDEDFFISSNLRSRLFLRSRLLGRLGWYRCRLRLRAQRLALYWYALPYRPSGPGHARDSEAWARMTENQDHQVSLTTAATTRKRCKADGSA